MYSDILEKYPPKDRSNLIGILQDIQDLHGFLSENALQDVADYVGVPNCTVYGVATFYNQFRLKPLGKNVIRICRGTACHVKNSTKPVSRS